MVKSGRNKEVPETAQTSDRERWGPMQSFVIAGKARTVFRLIELKTRQEELAKARKKLDEKKRKPG